MSTKPIPASYWVLPGRFLAGEYPGLRYDDSGIHQRLNAFLEAGVDVFIDLTDSGERPPYQPILEEEASRYNRQVRHLHFPFPDFHAPPRDAMVSALDAIDAALAENHVIYLHCEGGIGRTGTTVGCWLVRHGLAPAAALHRLQELYADSSQSARWPSAPEADDQRHMILHWEEHGLA